MLLSDQIQRLLGQLSLPVSLQEPDDALSLLACLNAPPRLLQHASLVAETLDEILSGLSEYREFVNIKWTRVGALLHDVGKVLYPEELRQGGSQHEAAGEALLLAVGAEAALAHVCVTHARWDGADVSLEERLVALADHLWKGKRDALLERKVVEQLAARKGADVWALFIPMDDLFEHIASGADERLARSQHSPH